jgi:hypothetical protein
MAGCARDAGSTRPLDAQRGVPCDSNLEETTHALFPTLKKARCLGQRSRAGHYVLSGPLQVR